MRTPTVQTYHTVMGRACPFWVATCIGLSHDALRVNDKGVPACRTWISHITSLAAADRWMDTLPFGEDAEKGNLEGRCTFLVRQQRECQVMLLQTRI